MKKMKDRDEEILQELIVTRNLSYRTGRLYRTTINKYVEFTGLSLTKLLEEAEREEEMNIAWKKSTLRKRLLAYRVYLYDYHMLSTAKSEFSRLLTIYRHFEFSFQKLPPISEKQSQEAGLNFKDLLTKEILQNAINISDKLLTAVILFQSSSGCATAETLNLKVTDFIASVEDYYKADNIHDLLDNLAHRDDIVPTFVIRRPKTGKLYYTFCTPEAFQSICYYLKSRKALLDSDRLFKVTQLHLMQKFREVNDILELGTVGKNNFVRFRSHMLRKYHATTLYNDGMTREVVNDLQGKAKNSVDRCYFFEDPVKLKAKYMEHMDALCINTEVTHLDVKSPEYMRMESELTRKNEEVSELNKRMDMLEHLITGTVDDKVVDILDKYS